MKFTLPSRKLVEHKSSVWRESLAVPGVSYAFRKISLGQRIELAKQVRELCLQNEFLQAGDAADQLESTLSDLLVRRLYLDWAEVRIDGLSIDGEAATSELLVERGPEILAEEILTAIQCELGLTEDERKNS